VQTRPEAGAPVFGYLKAGTEPLLAGQVAPDGWIAVAMPGPYMAYVKNGDLTKSLDVQTGANLYRQPEDGAPILAVAEKGDKVSITGLRGKWTQVRLDKTLTGYISVDPSPAVPAAPLGSPDTGAPLAAARLRRPAAGRQRAGTRRRLLGAERQFPAPAPRGQTRLLPSPPGRPAPFDWQIDDANGDRIAYVDVTKLLLTEQMAQYINHDVQVSVSCARSRRARAS